MQQIRITRTAKLNRVLAFLKERSPLLSEVEIIKMALLNKFYQETEEIVKRQNSRGHFSNKSGKRTRSYEQNESQ